MTFPETILPITVECRFDGTTWTDITGDVRAEQQIRITRGRTDWAQQVDYGRCSLTLGNTSGDYSPRNPNGAYFGQIGRNTPIRVSVGTGSVALDLPGEAGDYATTPDTAALDITGDIDIRIDATLENWLLQEYPSAGGSDYPVTELVAKRSSGQVSWGLYIKRGRPYFEWSSNGTAISTALCSKDLPLTASGRIALRVTLDVNDGAGGCVVSFYTSDSISGTWTLLESDTGAGTTSIYSGTAALRIGDCDESTTRTPALGRVHAVQVYNGIAGTLVASPDFTAQTSGTTSFADSAGRTWSLAGGAEITNRKVRFAGEVASWTPKGDTGNINLICEVEAAGVMRRLGTGAVPTKSPMYREFTSTGRIGLGVAAYWPMEDGADAVSLASAYPGHRAMTMTGSVTPAAYTDWVASDAIPTIGTGSLKVSVPSYQGIQSGGYSPVGFFCKVPAAGVVSTQRLISLSNSGSAATWSVYVNTSGSLDLRVTDADGSSLLTTGFNGQSINGLEKFVVVTMSQQNATTVSYQLYTVDIAGSLPTAIPNNTLTDEIVSTGTFSGTTGLITQIRFGEDGAMNGTALGHLVVGAKNSAFTGSAGALVGWNAEEGTSRIARIGSEEGLHAYATGAGDQQCGPQPRSTALETMRAAGDVDEGIPAELRTVLGIRHVARASMYNQPVALTLDYTGDDGLVTPLDPTDDDQSTTNDVTVQRNSGSSARATLDTGRLSTQAPPDGIGLYDTAVTLNLLDDGQAPQHAGWRLHLGTWDETRYPQVTVNLAGAPSSIETAAAVDTGSRIQITNPPSWLTPDTIDLRVEGYTETLDQYTWTIVYNCSPAGPWTIAVREDAALARRDTAGSQLAEDLTTTETAVDILATSGPLWTTSITDLPFDIRVGGEVMQVEPSGTTLTANASFESDTTGWTATSGTLTRSNSIRRVGSYSALLTTGTGANPRVEDTARTVTAGSTYTAFGWLYASVALPEPAGVNVNWYDSGGAYLSTSTNTATLTPGEWTPFNAQFTAPASAASAGVLFTVANTPGAGHLLHADNVKLITGGSGITSWLKDTFARTVSSSWGTPDTGSSWSTVGGGSASDYSVGSGYGVHTLASVDTTRRTAVTATHADFDLYADITTSALATGDSLYGGATARMQDASNLYVARLEFTTSNTVILSVRKIIADVQTQLGTYTVAGVTHVAGTFIRVRFQGNGSTLRAKAYLATDSEPSIWHIEATDTAITAANQIGTRSIRSTGNTNAASVQVRYDNFEVINPQTFTVSRSVNGVSKAQTSGEAVSLTQPATRAL